MKGQLASAPAAAAIEAPTGATATPAAEAAPPTAAPAEASQPEESA
jgi:hypothetical protein